MTHFEGFVIFQRRVFMMFMDLAYGSMLEMGLAGPHARDSYTKVYVVAIIGMMMPVFAMLATIKLCKWMCGKAEQPLKCHDDIVSKKQD